MKSPFHFFPSFVTGVAVVTFAFLAPSCQPSDSGGSNTNSGGSTAKGGSGGKGGAGGKGSGGKTSTGTGGDNSGGSGGDTSASGGTTTSNGGTTATSSSTATPGTGGTVGPILPKLTGTTVTFAKGKGVGAMMGYGWVALGALDTVSDPTCGATKTPITSTAACKANTQWTGDDKLCVSGDVPAQTAIPDYVANWGLSVGLNANEAEGAGLTQTFSSVTITVSGTPATGLRAVLHRSGDSPDTSYCAPLASGTALPMTSFNTKCYNTPPNGVALTAADVPNIDKISVQVSSGTLAIPVASLCITGITFAQ